MADAESARQRVSLLVGDRPSLRQGDGQPLAKGTKMDLQRFAIDGRVISSDDPRFQDALAVAYESPARPRCLCVPGGVEMYVAYHGCYVIKRMPETGARHHPGCASFEPAASESGLGELLGRAVIDVEPGVVELKVDFPWERVSGRAVQRGEPGEPGEVGQSSRRMSLRALTHFLFVRAGFNRWSPAMEGKRNQGVLHKYLMEAADGVRVKGVPLPERLYVPEPFNEARRDEVAERRRKKLSVLQPHDGRSPLVVVLGEFKACEPATLGRRVWVKHMPDMPLLVSDAVWSRVERPYQSLFEARDADAGAGVRLVMTALVSARRELTYEVEALSLMLTSEHFIPLEGVHELPLIRALVVQQRRFVKPLRFDACSAAEFASALLLDAGPKPVALHVVSAFLSEKHQQGKEAAVARTGPGGWIWRTDRSVPELPIACHPNRRVASHQ